MRRLAGMIGLSSLCLTLACDPGPSAGRDPGGGGKPSQDGGGVVVGGPDGGVVTQPDPDPTPQGCGRDVLTTAPLTLLHTLRAELKALPANERAARVDQFLAEVEEQGGTPLWAPGTERVAFLARGTPQGGFSVAGSFNGWTPRVTWLEPVEGTDLHAVELQVPRHEAHAYKLVEGDVWREDLRAHHVVWDGIDRKAPGEFNAFVYPALQNGELGRLVALRGVPSQKLGDRRDVFVYVPRVYDSPDCEALPTLLFHDGNESLTRAPFTAAADDTYRTDPEAAALLVFVALPSQDVRTAEYTFGPGSRGDGYLAFLRDELLPLLQKRFRLCDGAHNRGLAGASLGGLISAYGAFELPETFGYVGSQSGSYWWQSSAFITRVAESPRLPLRWYLDHGCPNDNCESNTALLAGLQQKAYPVRYVKEDGAAHDWAFWQRRLPGLLRYFREGQETRCAQSR